jgi:predicted ribosome quality control (RQC) complex YloA/Tae2 family protein
MGAYMLKKSMDVIDAYSWVSINRNIANCFVDNAYRAKYYWLLKLRCKGEVKLLKVEPGQRLHFSKSEPQVKEIDNFARYLRAHVRDGRILGVELPWWERIILIKTMRSSKELIHYVELVPRGLWVIADSSNRIIYANKFEEFRDRVVKIGTDYKPPPPRGIPPTDKDSLYTSLLKGKDLVRGIVTEWGLPGYIAEELLLRAGLYSLKNKRPSDIDSADVEVLVNEYKKLVEESLTGKGYVVVGDSGYDFYSPYKPRLFEEIYDREIRVVGLIDDAIDAYFTQLESILENEERKKELERRFESWRKRLEEQRKIIDGFKRELSEIESKLNMIYENYQSIQEILECARNTREKEGWSAVEKCNVQNYDPRKGVIYIKVGDTELPLSIRHTLESQILELEKEKGELEKKIEKAMEVLKELESKSIDAEKELSVKVYSKPSPRFWYDRFRWTITRGGFLVIAGRDASQNEVLVRKYLGDEDIFLHADIHGAPATILLKQGKEPSIEDIEDAAVLAACYSRAWKANYSFVEVYWVKGSQVSKTPPPGEYLGKGSFMIYGDRNYLRTTLSLGVGLRIFCDDIYGEYVRLFVGNPELVKKEALSYTIIIPGENEPSKLAKQISQILLSKAQEKTGIKYIVNEHLVQELLPGSSRIIEYGVGEGKEKCDESRFD